MNQHQGQQAQLNPGKKVDLSPGQEHLKGFIHFLWGAVFLQIVVNIAASFIFPLTIEILRKSWIWVVFWVIILLTLLAYPTKKGQRLRLLPKGIAILFFLPLIIANCIMLMMFHWDVPGQWFRGPTLLYQADWSYGLNGWTSPKIGASAQSWYDSHGELASSGQLTSYFDSRCPGNQHVCFSDFSTIVAPYQPGVAPAPPGFYGIQDYMVEVQIRLNSEESNSGGGHGFGLGVRRYFDGKLDEGYGWKVVEPASGEDYIALYGQPDTKSLMSKPFSPGDNWRTYRIEVNGSDIRLMVDGATVFDRHDARFTHGGWVEMWENSDMVSVRSFTVSRLSA